ncbi:MAG: tetratricopeptide repeat protein [Acidobacteria bacterium]|nr:tetratricopeptide repeat protein [Acidobacteriota bacterium]
MGDSSPNWVWFLDQDMVETCLRTEKPPEGVSSRAAAHPAVVEAVRRQIQDDADGALRALAPAIALDNPDALWLAGQLCFERNQFTEAAGYYGRLAAKQPGHPFASFNQAVALGRNRDYAEALEALQCAVVLDPSRPQAWFALGVCLLHCHRAAEARAAFRHSLELRPGYAPALFGEASALQLDGKPGEALAIYDRLAENLPAGGGSAELEAVLENALSAAITCLDHGAASRYAGLLRQANPTSTAALAALAVAALNQQDHHGAVQWLGSLVEAKPDSFEDWFNLAVAFSHAADWPHAAHAFETALQLRPNDGDSLEGVSRAWTEQGEFGKALALTDQLTKCDPSRGGAWFRLGWLRMAEPHSAEDAILAAEAFRHAAACEPHWVEAWCNLGMCLYETNQGDAARDAYQSALACDPSRSAAHVGLALLELDNRQVTEAEEHYRIAATPQLEIEFRLAMQYEERGDFVTAKKHYESVLQLDPECAPAHWNLGHMLFALGEREKAQSHWRKALDVDPAIASEPGG